jgi:preprotein translocase subunit SecG
VCGLLYSDAELHRVTTLRTLLFIIISVFFNVVNNNVTCVTVTIDGVWIGNWIH